MPPGAPLPYEDQDRRPFTDMDIWYVFRLGLECGLAGAAALALLALLARRLA